MNEKSFDVLAKGYDDNFSRSVTGSYQRMVSRKWLQKFLDDKHSLKILEINCGTGDDALWLSSLGHQVVATDASPKMIEMAKAKLDFHNEENAPQFSVCDFTELNIDFKGQQFDLIFSNFAGLNCAAPEEMIRIGEQLRRLLKPDGHLAVVVFGKHTWWETVYFLFKLQPKNAFRRWSNEKTQVQLAKHVQQPVYYYSIADIVRLLGAFDIKAKKPVGLFIPPSYLDQSMQKRKPVFKFLAALEKGLGRISLFSSFADHTYILLKKRS